jgi:UDP:flavonoid glycosyltransferase YjiC (YdhE family)
MARFHLCWELGGGLGHAARLKVLAGALLARGHEVSISLRDLAQVHSLFGGDPRLPGTPAPGVSFLGVPLLQAPVWLHRTEGMPANHASHAEILLTAGYLQAAPLAGLVAGWRAMFSLLRPDVVVADYAPTAVLAARSMGLHSASVGSAFSMPPPGRALPCLREWENIPPERLASAEARVLQAANAVLAHYGAPPLAWTADLLLGDAPLLTTWPEIDPFNRDAPAFAAPDSGSYLAGAASARAPCTGWYGPAFLPAGGELPAWPPGAGPKVFAYLKTGHADHVEVLAALVQEGCRVLCYLPEVASGKAPPVVAANLAFARGPVALQATLAEAQLCVTHGGEATLAQAMLAGVPVLMLPMQLEQFLTARRIAAAGMGVNAAMLAKPVDWRALVRHLLSMPGYAAAAQAFAARKQAYKVEEMATRVAMALERRTARS